MQIFLSPLLPCCPLQRIQEGEGKLNHFPPLSLLAPSSRGSKEGEIKALFTLLASSWIPEWVNFFWPGCAACVYIYLVHCNAYLSCVGRISEEICSMVLSAKVTMKRPATAIVTVAAELPSTRPQMPLGKESSAGGPTLGQMLDTFQDLWRRHLAVDARQR